jgi:anthranilate phosphoribosyltransferase
LKTILNRLINHETLSEDEAKNVLIAISESKFNPSQIASFLTIFMMRPIAISELLGFRSALLELCVKIDLSDFNTIDLCGTGGDGKNTFNISTTAAFVVAGAGVKVAKHGNYGVSSISGSSNVLEYLGIKFSNNPDFLKKSIDKAGICILHAPLFHPAMKNVAPIRKELGVKTFFNILGPMVNPSFPQNQLIGVFNLELARMFAYVYQNTKTNYNIIHNLDGYDEISLTNATKSITKTTENLLESSNFNIETINPQDIFGGKTIAENATIFMNILDGKGSQAQQNVVCANAALAISTVESISLEKAFEKATESLLLGNAKNSFSKLHNHSQN